MNSVPIGPPLGEMALESTLPKPSGITPTHIVGDDRTLAGGIEGSDVGAIGWLGEVAG